MTYFYHIPPSAAPIYLKDIWNGLQGFLQTRDYLTKFRMELREYFQTKEVFLVSSGRAALTVILQALFRVVNNIQRDEVIIPAYTCYSVPAAIVKAGFKVKLCDIDPNTLDFDYSLLSDIISESTLAVIPCNLFGIPSDIERLQNIIGGEKIFIIDDAAQAMGASRNGRLAGTRGDIGFYSLDRGKNLTTVEGGIILTKRKDVADEVRKITNKLNKYTKSNQSVLLMKAMIVSLLLRPFLYWIPANLPGLGLGKTIYSIQFPIRRMSNTQAGLAWNWREKLAKFNKVRRENTEYFYNEFFGNHKIHCLKKNSGATYQRFPVFLNGIKNIDMNKLKRLGMSKMYPDSIDHIPDLKFHNENGFSVAKEISKKLFCLPTHSYLDESSRQKLVLQLQKEEESYKGI